MRPSAAQLLQHERLEFAHKVFETQKQLVLLVSWEGLLTAFAG